MSERVYVRACVRACVCVGSMAKRSNSWKRQVFRSRGLTAYEVKKDWASGLFTSPFPDGGDKTDQTGQLF